MVERNQLQTYKVENLLATEAEAVVSANPGCPLQRMSGLRRSELITANNDDGTITIFFSE